MKPERIVKYTPPVKKEAAPPEKEPKSTLATPATAAPAVKDEKRSRLLGWIVVIVVIPAIAYAAAYLLGFSGIGALSAVLKNSTLGPVALLFAFLVAALLLIRFWQNKSSWGLITAILITLIIVVGVSVFVLSIWPNASARKSLQGIGNTPPGVHSVLSPEEQFGAALSKNIHTYGEPEVIVALVREPVNTDVLAKQFPQTKVFAASDRQWVAAISSIKNGDRVHYLSMNEFWQKSERGKLLWKKAISKEFGYRLMSVDMDGDDTPLWFARDSADAVVYIWIERAKNQGPPA